MTVDEMVSRIVRAHLLLLLVCLVAPVSVVAYREAHAVRPWVATVRLQVGAKAPSSATEADALSSRVLALATTPYLVEQALDAADLRGDPAALVQHDISSQRLGESPIVELSVANRSRSLARAQVQAIAQRVVGFMNNGNQSAFRAQLAAVRTQLTAAVVARDRAARRVAAAPVSRPVDQAQLADAQADVDRLNATQAQLEVTDATRDLVVLINGDHPQTDRRPSPLLPRGALALLLGLLLGVSLAVVVETLRPRASGARAVARLVDAPLLGSGNRPDSVLLQTLTLACRRQGVDTVALVGVDGTSERAAHQLLRQLAAVDADLHQHATQPVGPRFLEDDPSDGEPPSRVRFCALGEVRPLEELTAGLLVVSAGSPLQRDVDAVSDIVQTTRWPVVGVVDGAVTGSRNRR